MKLQNNTLFHIIHVGKLLERQVEKTMKSDFNISHADAKLLVLVGSQAHVSQIMLAEAMSVSAAAISRQIDKLETNGLVSRKPDPNSRRTSHIILTQKGRVLQEKVITQFTEILHAIAKADGQISAQTHKELINLEKRLEKNDSIAQNTRIQITNK